MSAAAKFKFVSRQHHVEISTHLFRALLRECSYLPDPASQLYIKKYVVSRFRNASQRGSVLLRQATSDTDEAKQHAAREELRQSLRKGYKGLYQLIRANEGEIKPLMRVLRHTYGRNGPRRYELMRTLLVPDVDVASSNDPLSQNNLKDKKKWDITTVPVPDALEAPSSITGDVVVYSISPRYSKLKAIATTQTQKNIETNRTRLSKRISIPAKNAWGRQMPRKRVRNMVQRKYASFLDAILPPLPEDEWLRLQGLVLGTVPWEGCKPRRKRPEGCRPFLTASDLEKLAHIDNELGEKIYLDPVDGPAKSSTWKADKIIAAAGDERIRGYWGLDDAWLADNDAVNHAFETVLKDELQLQMLNKNLTGKHRGHRITPRFMRHLWTAIFKTCPMLQQDGQERKWNVVWGSASRTPSAALPESRINELFGLEKLG